MRFLRFLGTVAIATLLTLAAADAIARAAFPHLLRLERDFSATYLRRVLSADRNRRPIVVLGDSALWGYDIRADQVAASILMHKGWPIENLAYEGGSTANTYAMLRVLLHDGVRPRLLVFNVNLKEFSAGDSAYRTLHPTVERLVWPLLTPAERALLVPHVKQTLDAKIDRALGNVWFLYGIRSDLRDKLFGHTDMAHAVRAWTNGLSGERARLAVATAPTADRFLGTYDLDPLTRSNVEVVFLRKIVGVVKRRHLPAIAILTPTNHALLHEYIDSPAYQDQLAYVTAILHRAGIRVLDYDARFPARDFIDNDHLTPAGNAKLAAMLERELPR